MGARERVLWREPEAPPGDATRTRKGCAAAPPVPQPDLTSTDDADPPRDRGDCARTPSGKAPLVALLALGSLASCARSATGTFADASIVDRAPVDSSCTGLPGPSSVEGVDPATGCPALARVERRVAAPMSCERLEPRCAIPVACRFPVALLALPSSACGRPPLSLRFESCRCEFGVIECPGESPGWGPWPGCTANAMLCDPCLR